MFRAVWIYEEADRPLDLQMAECVHQHYLESGLIVERQVPLNLLTLEHICHYDSGELPKQKQS